MKIGDKVRFLNAVGGGIVKGFKNKDIVWVEEEDGFETPALIRECIVMESGGQQVKTPSQAEPPRPVIQAEPPKPKPEKQEITETSGGDRLNVYLAYLPMDIKLVGKCNYETFLVNDSNYYLFFNYMSRKNNAWLSRHSEIIEPNTRLFIEEFSKEQINDLEKICIQFIAFKKDKPYSLKNAYSVELRIDGVKFYKLHSFRENDFFDDEALIYPVVVNDTAEREMLISATDLQEAMTQKAKYDFPNRRPEPVKKEKAPTVIEVDLHINQLLDSTAGMSNTDIINVQLEKFHTIMKENKNKKGQKIVFIHGKGEGVLRNAVLSELKLKYKNFPVQDASFKEYGFGATMVTIACI
ncbi:mannonate oxidoreductase [Bacteroidia bacterium]|nr:mannonate oxidoreductase [Bacteroidia bacterium]GHT84948.1 mannonate oxidoreductase [Bacteroidia bacterium]GHV70206.1 mannonate oxidoreductase [Bacteroidia bacterium]